jgi:hypothetical protein
MKNTLSYITIKVLTLYKFKKIAIGYGCGVDCDTEVWFKND